MYDIFFRHVLTRMDPETAHVLTLRLLVLLQRIPGALWLIRRVVGRVDPRLEVEALGQVFPTPFGLAAGFDKDARVYRAMGAFGFGHVEVGTITGHAQAGNPKPRMFRLPRDRALVNRMGFNNQGAEVAARHLVSRDGDQVVGVNIGRTKVVDDALSDYRRSTRLLAPHADYLVVNVSSPNTPGLRDLQAVDSLRPLLAAVLDECRAGGAHPPVLVKIAPDLADHDVDAVADLAQQLGLAGIIATNTTITRDNLHTSPAVVDAAGSGGLSGSPLRERSLEILGRLRGRVGTDLTLISVGGVESADDVWERIAAGASLVQAYTGMVYGGPLFCRRIQQDLLARLVQSPFTTIDEVRGTAA